MIIDKQGNEGLGLAKKEYLLSVIRRVVNHIDLIEARCADQNDLVLAVCELDGFLRGLSGEDIPEAEGFVYITSPFTRDFLSVSSREQFVAEYVARCISSGEAVFSPVVYLQELRRQAKTPLPDVWESHWRESCIRMLRKASQLRVLRLPGWVENEEILREIKEAERLGIPVVMEATGKRSSALIDAIQNE